jgi:hypothetical protein
MATANVQIKKILVGRGNTTVASNYSGVRGEITMDTGLNTLRIHDGTTVGGTRLATYAELANVSVGNVNLSGYVTTAQITAANANAAVQATSINSINANLGAFQTYANATFGTSSYSNANVKSYMAAFDGNIIPSANVTYSLGTSTHQWKDLWVSNNTIYIGNVPIRVSGNTLLINGQEITAAANLEVVNANIAAANLAISAVTSAWTANAATQATDINALRANITAANVAWQANTGTLAGSITSNYNTLIANLAFAHGEIDGLRANIIASNVSVASLQSNAGTQQTQINSINANVAAANAAIAALQTGSGFATVDQITANLAVANSSIVTANTGMKSYVDAVTTALTTNASTQATQINSTNANVTAANVAIATLQTQAYTNTNAAAYLAGNVNVGNLTVETNAVVLGNLRVQGTQTTVNAATLTVNDLWVTVANGAVQASDANGAGIRVAGALANIAYSSTTDSFNFNKPITVDKLFTGNITSGTQSWTFGTDGRLAIPAGTYEPGHENYTGITFSGNNITKYILDEPNSLGVYIGNSNSYWRFDTDGNLKLPSTENNGFIFGYAGTGFDFTRITADGSFLNPSLVLHTGDANTDERHAWSFDSVGNITLPDSTKFSGNTTYLPNGQGFNWKFYDPMIGSDTVNLYMNGLTTGYDSWALSTGNGTNSWMLDSSTQEFSLFNGGVDGGKLVFGTAANAGVRSSIDDIELKSSTGNVFIRANAEPWTFREDGNLVLPSNMIFASSPAVSGTGIIFGDGKFQRTAWTGEVARLTNNGYDVTLGSSGTLTIPNAIAAQAGQYFVVTSDTSTEMSWANSIQDPSTGVYSGIGSGSSGTSISVANTDVTGTWVFKNWDFDMSGNLTVPGDILPAVDNTHDLGSATQRFRHLYVGPGTVYVGNAAIKTTATGNLILPGLTRAIASTAYAEEVYEEDDQELTFTTVPTVIDNARYSDLSGRVNGLSFTPAQYSVDQLDGEGYIDGITITSPGSGYSDQVARLAEEDMWATEVANPFASFVSNDWVRIPFRVNSRAGESEYEFNQGGGSSDRLVNESYELVLDDNGHINLPGGSIRQAADEDLVIRVKDADDDGYRLDLIVVDDNDDTLTRVEVHRDGVEILTNFLSGNAHGWYFRDNGNLQLPAGGDIVDSTGASVLGIDGNVLAITSESFKQWTFNVDGDFYIPPGSTIRDAVTGDDLLVAVAMSACQAWPQVAAAPAMLQATRFMLFPSTLKVNPTMKLQSRSMPVATMLTLQSQLDRILADRIEQMSLPLVTMMWATIRYQAVFTLVMGQATTTKKVHKAYTLLQLDPKPLGILPQTTASHSTQQAANSTQMNQVCLSNQFVQKNTTM